MKNKLLAGIILSGMLISACQSTPDKDIVVQKGQDINEATGETDSVQTYQYPTKWQEDLIFETAKVKVPVNADIEVPDIKSIPVYHGNTESALPQAVVDKVIEEFFGDSKITDSNRQKTKEEIKQDISDYQQKISEQKGDKETISIFENKIKELEKLLSTAPDHADNQSVNTDISVVNSNDSYGFSGTGKDENGKPLNISVASKDKDFGNSITVNSATHSVIPIPDSEDISQKDGDISQEEAITQATELVNRLGIQDMQLSDAEIAGLYESSSDVPTDYGYTVTFTRTVNDIVSHTQSFMSETINGEEYGPAIFNETISIGLTSSGIWEFSWDGYFELGEKKVDNAALLSFEEVQEAFKQSIKLGYSNNADAGGFMQLKVTSIVLGYSKTGVKNKPGEFMLTPVWNFYGEFVSDDGWSESDFLIMSINAVDGSIS